VGKRPAPALRQLADEGALLLTGEVPDARPYIAGAAVYIVPMRIGGGVRLKLLQAMAMERAIVSTPMGAEGVEVMHGRELLLATSPQAFARSVLGLMPDPGRRGRLGQAARELVVSRYNWSALLPALDRIYPGLDP
jgi:glycosyltransferase involved in cell wall biosynthesis